jgi:hypothetical protein
MTTHIKNLFPLSVLLAGFVLILAAPVTAQTFTNLFSFTDGSDGAFPYAGLMLSGNTLYGTAPDGGSGGNGPQPILPHARSVKRIFPASYGHPHNH